MRHLRVVAVTRPWWSSLSPQSAGSCPGSVIPRLHRSPRSRSGDPTGYRWSSRPNQHRPNRPSAPPPPGSRSPAPGRATGGPGPDRHRLTGEERARIWEQATAAAAHATEQVQAAAGSDPQGAGDAAWAASDFLASAARVVEGRRGGPLTAAAATYDRAARELWGRLPAPSQAGQGLRAASVLLASARFVGRGENTQLLALLAQLAARSDAVTGLRETQDRAAQAAAARSAAEQLRLSAGQLTSVGARPAGATATQARRAGCPSTSAGPGPDPPKAQPGRTADVAVRAGSC